MNPTPSQQDFSSHRRYVPGYHFVALALLFVNLVYATYNLIRDFDISSLVATGTAIGLILVFYYAREFPLRVQDRVIRLEESLRLQQLLPDDLRAGAASLSIDQLVALRFASDAEVPALVRKVITEGIVDRDDIKKLVKDWRPDNHRI